MKHFLLIGAMTKSSILGYFFNPRVILPFFFQNTQDLKTKKKFVKSHADDKIKKPCYRIEMWLANFFLTKFGKIILVKANENVVRIKSVDDFQII